MRIALGILAFFGCLTLFCLVAISPVAAVFDDSPSPSAKYVPNQLVVKFKPSFLPSELQAWIDIRRERSTSWFGQALNFQENLRLQLSHQQTPEAAQIELTTAKAQFALSGESVLFPQKSGDLGRYVVYTSQQAIEVTNASSQFARLSTVESAEPNLLMYTMEAPNDTLYPKMWALTKIHASEAWDATTGDNNVIVADLDTGLDTSHQDFQNRTIRTVGGINDGNGHGTHTAGTIAAMTNNGLGVAGINWNVTLLPIKVIGDDGHGSGTVIAAGIRQAVDNGAKVMNMSIGSRDPELCPNLYKDAFNYAYSKNVTAVVAAGNASSDAAGYTMANCPHVIVVSATGSNNQFARYSNSGSLVTVAAPGGYPDHDNNGDGVIDTKDCQGTAGASGCILSTWPGNRYISIVGTSMATPHVTGLVALMLSKNPNLTPDQIKQILTSTADDLGPPGRDDQFGAGLINAKKALDAVTGGNPTATPTVPPTPTPTLPPPTPTPTPTSVLSATPTPTSAVSPTVTVTLAPSNTPTPTQIVAEGCPTECPGDFPKRSVGNANCDNVIDERDYILWRTQFQTYQSGSTIAKENRTADFYCSLSDPSSQRVDMIDFEYWRSHAYPPPATPPPTPTPTAILPTQIPSPTAGGHTPTLTPTVTLSPSPTGVNVKALTGKIVYAGQTANTAYWNIYTMEANGINTQRITTDARNQAHPNFSPRGDKIVFHEEPLKDSSETFTSDIFIINSDGTNKVQLTHATGLNYNPVFSPSGTKIAFEATGNPPSSTYRTEIYTMNVDGTGLTKLTNSTTYWGSHTPSYSPDGTKIIFSSDKDEDRKQHIYIMNTDGSNVHRLTSGYLPFTDPIFSKDGNEIYYVTVTNDKSVIMTMGLDGSHGRRYELTDALTPRYPANSPDGKFILFTANQGGKAALYVLDIRSGQLAALKQDTISDATSKSNGSGFAWISSQ